MASVVDIRTRHRLSNQSLGEILSVAVRRCIARTTPYGVPINEGHCLRCTSPGQIHRAARDGYRHDPAGSTADYVLMVKPV